MEKGFYAHGELTIPANGTDTNALHIGAFAQVGFVLPATFTGTGISFLVSVDGTTFVPFNNDSGLVSLIVTQGKAYAFPINLFPFQWIKLKSGSTEGTARTIQWGGKY
jgi:hypothetical protein